MAEEFVDFVVATGDFDAFGGGASVEECGDRLGGAAVFPVGVDCGFDG